MREELARALSDPGLFATCAIALLVDRFGMECLNWEPETLEMEIRGFGANPPADLMDRINAAAVVLTTDMPHRDVIAFNNVCRSFNFERVSGRTYLPASLEDVLWGCAEMRLLEGQEDYDAQGFSPEIAAYVGQLIGSYGISTPPSFLKFAETDRSVIERLDENLAGDSIMFQAYWDTQRETVSDMEDFVKDKTNDLLAQLAYVPIRNKDKGFVSAVREMLTGSISKKSSAEVPAISRPELKDPSYGEGSESGKRVVLEGKGEGKKAVAGRNMPQGSDIGNVTRVRDFIRPDGEASVERELTGLGRHVSNAVPGNAAVINPPDGEARMVARQDIRKNEPITTDLSSQDVIPPNIVLLNRLLAARKDSSSVL